MKSRRSGFTLIEMLVVIAIIGMLAALLLPAINRARERGRQVQCMNNLKQIAAAMVAFEGRQNRLPNYGTFSRTDASPSLLDFANPRYSWVKDILPFLERSDIADNWGDSVDDDPTPPGSAPAAPFTPTPGTPDPTYYGYPNNDDDGDLDINDIDNYALSHKAITVLTCPNDSSAIDLDGSNSYVVNVGFIEPGSNLNSSEDPSNPDGFPDLMNHNWSRTAIDWNNNGTTNPSALTYTLVDKQDLLLKRGTGVFWAGSLDGRSVEDARVNFSQIQSADGLSTTVMATENMNAGFQADAGRAGSSGDDLTWAYPEVSSVGFGVSTWDLGGDDFNDPVGSFPNEPYSIPPADFNSKINRDAGVLEGESPFPSSFHPGLVLVAFCDGRVTTLQQDVSPLVWYKLVTPRGTKFKDDIRISGELWMKESPLGENDF